MFENSNDFPEEWAVYRVLSHHPRDVFGVEWSPDSNLLASCSVDNFVIVYDLKKERIVKRLQLKSMVKGMSWDPIGRFLVAQTENSFTIFQTSDWTLVREVTDIFRRQSSPMFLRPSWRIDGENVLVPNSFSNASSIVTLLARGTFSTAYEVHLPGNISSVAKCTPVLFESTKKDAPNHLTYFAIAGSDKTLYVYSTQLPKPLIVLKDIFTGSVTDLAWTSDGRKLIGSSASGEVLLFDFNTVFPNTMEKERLKNILKEKYGDMSISSNISEYPSLPLFPNVEPVNPQTAPPTTTPTRVSHTTKSTNVNNDNVTSSTTPTKSSTTSSNITSTQTHLSIEQQQKETKSKDGKRRITPVLIGKASTQIALSSILGTDDATPNPSTFNSTTDVSFLNGGNTINFANGSGIPALPNIEVSADPNMKKRMLADEIRDENNAMQRSTKKRNTKKDEEEEGEVTFTIGQYGELLCTVEGDISYFENGTKLWNVFIGEKPSMATGNSKFIALASEPCSVHVFSKVGRRLFPPFVLTAPVKYLSCSTSNFLAVVCDNLDSWVWDIPREKIVTNCTVDDVLARYPNPNLIQCDFAAVTEQGALVVIMSSGESFSFNDNMKTWFCVADAHAHLSPYHSTLPQSNSSTISLRTLRSRAASVAEGKRMQGEDSFSSKRHGKHTKEDLEVALSAAAAIGDKKEYLHFLSIYVKHLCAVSDVTTLREFCHYLLGIKGGDATQICGMQGKEVLKFVLHSTTGNPAIQRLANEIRELIKQG